MFKLHTNHIQHPDSVVASFPCHYKSCCVIARIHVTLCNFCLRFHRVGNAILAPYGAFPLGPATTVLSHALTPTTRLTAYPAPPIAAPYPMFYWPYPSPPVSPTSAYYSSLPHHIVSCSTFTIIRSCIFC